MVIALSPGPAIPASAGVPYQFIAKTYTEALGRAPDSTGYGLSVQSFRTTGCSLESLRAWARQYYDSPLHPSLAEYGGNYPRGSGATTADSVARILTLYRGILNREPTRAEFDRRILDYRFTSWSALLEDVLHTPEFAALVPKICGRDFYGFGGPQYPVIDVPFVAPAFEVAACPAECISFGQCRSDVPDANALQTAMYCASQRAGPGGTVTVELAPQAVFRLHATLVVPGNVILRTRTPARGWPWFPSRQYALMARLVRASNFGGPLVLLNRVAFGGVAEGRAQLQHIWVDGHRGPVEANVPDVNVAVSGGSGAEVSGCRINSSAGWTNILADGMSAGAPCSRAVISRNLITEYTSCHSQPDAPNLWTDGISTSCENTLIEDNQIVDATDVGIVIFKGTESTTQRSVARRNHVFSAGNAAWAALAADPLFGPYSREFDFTGTRFEDNLIWSGNGHFDIGMLVGTAAIAWGGPPDIGRGAAFTGNSVGWPALACSARVDFGIAVSGMMDATVAGNRLGLQLVDLGNCPGLASPCGSPNPPPRTASVVASRCAGLASGTIQDALDFRISRCLGHSPPHPACADGLNVGSAPPEGPGGKPAPAVLSLNAVFPNPTRGDLSVRFTTLEAGPVQLELLDVAGRRVAVRDTEHLVPGPHEVLLSEGSRLPPGIYVVRVGLGALEHVQRIIVLN